MDFWGFFHRRPCGVRFEPWRHGVLIQERPSSGLHDLHVGLKDNEVDAKSPKG